MNKRNICVITGSRAEYGLLRNLCILINKDSELILQLIVTGSHLSTKHGLTIEEIKKDKFKINKKINILVSNGSRSSMIKSTGIALIKFSKAINDLNPSLIIILGDRYEILSAAISSYFLNIPIAHIHGGESTYGAIDEGIRHSITKMSWLHFASTENYKKRVIQLGENPKRVFNVGSLGVESIKSDRFISKKKIEALLKIKLNKNNLIVVYHPETIGNASPSKIFKEILNSLDKLNNTFLIFTTPNADPGSLVIRLMMKKYVKANSHKSKMFSSLGHNVFLSTLKVVDGIIGNSSSGIIEAPSLGSGTINIGDRQSGREMSKSIINCAPKMNEIDLAIKKLNSKKFINSLRNVKNPYANGKTSKKIIDRIKNINLPKNLNKIFYDL